MWRWVERYVDEMNYNALRSALNTALTRSSPGTKERLCLLNIRDVVQETQVNGRTKERTSRFVQLVFHLQTECTTPSHRDTANDRVLTIFSEHGLCVPGTKSPLETIFQDCSLASLEDIPEQVTTGLFIPDGRTSQEMQRMLLKEKWGPLQKQLAEAAKARDCAQFSARRTTPVRPLTGHEKRRADAAERQYKKDN